MPDFSRELVADSEGISSLDELDAAGRALVDCGCDQDVEMVWHDRKGVKCESALLAVTEESGDHEFGVCCALGDPVTLVGEDGDGVGALLVTDRSHAREHTPGVKTPSVPWGAGGPSLKAWLT